MLKIGVGTGSAKVKEVHVVECLSWLTVVHCKVKFSASNHRVKFRTWREDEVEKSVLPEFDPLLNWV